ncbi:1-acyl-sn-glycerol-3-phosphate acyltransferase [Dermabacteraceae bacterium TAE3-ERU5]|nr:1-acyl-sn-glycerol-3-phosphate acyltransferase [Dermabacteraceae bacterium TAE3-ERU5]
MSRVLTKQTVTGAENLPRGGAAILVGNHLSGYDAVSYGRLQYERGIHPRFLAKHTLFQIPVGGRLLRMLGTIPVYRGTERAKEALAAALAVLEEKHTVTMFPEGTYSYVPSVVPLQGKTGAVRLSLLTGAPIIPVGSWGSQNVWHPEKLHPSLWPKPHVHFVVSAPWTPKLLPGESEAAGARRMTAELMDKIAELTAVARENCERK